MCRNLLHRRHRGVSRQARQSPKCTLRLDKEIVLFAQQEGKHGLNRATLRQFERRRPLKEHVVTPVLRLAHPHHRLESPNGDDWHKHPRLRETLHEAGIPPLAVLEARLVEIDADPLPPSLLEHHCGELIVQLTRQLAVGRHAVRDKDVRPLVHHVLERAEIIRQQLHVAVRRYA